jgi:microcystin-dependent protein
LTSIDFTTVKYLGITVDTDNVATTADPEMEPRQILVPSFHAKKAEVATNATKLNGFDWSSILVGGNNNPTTALIRGNRIESSGITALQIQDGTIAAADLGSGAVTTVKIGDGQVTSAKIADDTITLADIAKAAAAQLMPPGGVIAYGGATEPTGWLICDGRAVSRTTYDALFAAIGVAHGSGDGSNTFNLPDFRWTFLRGFGPNITVAGTGTATGNQATFTNHGFNRSGVKVRVSGTLPGLSANTDYWVIVVDANTLAFASTKASAVAATPTRTPITGAYTATIVQWEDPDLSSRELSATGSNGGANVGSYQADILRSHSHSITPSRIDGIVRGFVGGGYSIPGGGNVNANNFWDFSIGATGGNETRPQNISVNYIIKH